MGVAFLPDCLGEVRRGYQAAGAPWEQQQQLYWLTVMCLPHKALRRCPQKITSSHNLHREPTQWGCITHRWQRALCNLLKVNGLEVAGLGFEASPLTACPSCPSLQNGQLATYFSCRTWAESTPGLWSRSFPSHYQLGALEEHPEGVLCDRSTALLGYSKATDIIRLATSW